jgi:short-subunit dehydrogenase
MKVDGCIALITGASAGIGWECARQLAPRARALVLVARRQERLEQLRHALRQECPRLEIHTRATDLGNKAQLDELVQWLDTEKLQVDLLVNNAGLGDYGWFVSSDLQRDDQILQVNVVGLTLLTRRLLPQMVSRRRGAILNVSSSAGFLPMPGMAIYAATKAYVTSFSEALRVELRNSGVTVTALCPGPVHTEFGDVAKRTGDEAMTGPAFVYVSVQRVVADALAAVEANKPLVIPGLFMKIGMLLVRITPMALLRFVWQFRPQRN